MTDNQETKEKMGSQDASGKTEGQGVSGKTEGQGTSQKPCKGASGCNPFRFLFELILIAAVAFLGYQLYQKQGFPGLPPTEPVSNETADSQTLEALQKLAVKMGATNSDSLTDKNALDLISDIQIKLDSAQNCNCSSLEESETSVLDDLLTGGHPATLAKIKQQDAFIKECSGAKVLILKK